MIRTVVNVDDVAVIATAGVHLAITKSTIEGCGTTGVWLCHNSDSVRALLDAALALNAAINLFQEEPF